MFYIYQNQVFEKSNYKDKLEFFPDDKGKNCVKIKLAHEPMEKSITLTEGPLVCSSPLYSVEGKEITFRDSMYENLEDYEKELKEGGENLYVVRYLRKL
ncbi:hypothetical protein ES695_08535 [Candidatus Atribacteria bacterium 1244-E10-H5-B2]|nr:MAG: hypothetical protein ES695_08535 [Candidatus Atribacteria bacterium 1244-E10-H5-B2]